MKSKLSRREFLRGLSLTAASAFLAACAPQQTPTAEAEPTEAVMPTEAPEDTVVPPAPEEIKLSYWGHAYEGRVQAADQGIALYLEDHPNAEIDHQTLPDLWGKIQTSFAADTQPDIFSIDNGVLPRYASSDLLIPIDPTPWGLVTEEEVFDLFEPGSIDYLKYQGHLWGPPMEVSVHSPAYRLDHFEEYGLDPDNPPDTWQDWVDAGLAQKDSYFDDDGVRVRQWFEWYNPGYYLVFLGPILAELGGWWFHEDGSPALNTDAGLKMLQFFYDTQHTWELNDPGFASPDDLGHFVAGRETYAWHNFPGSRWVSTTFEGMEYGVGWKLQPMFRWEGVAERKNIGYAYGFFVTKACEQPRQAWEFVEVITHYPEQTEAWIDLAGLVQPYKGWSELPKVKDLPFVEIFNREFEWSIPNILHPKMNEIGNLVTESLGRLAAVPPDDVEVVAEDYDAKLEEILAS
jgi:ABC-type glycerol-3-phosphate transport system substrate-binding protein